MAEIKFSGKVVLITGASSGIGAETAIHFAKLGAHVSLIGRNEANLTSVALKCKNLSGKEPLIVLADVVKDGEKIINSTVERFGRLDVLVNNAGVLAAGPMGTVRMEDYDTLFKVNVRAVIELTNLAVPHLAKTKGNIVNVSSITGLRSFPNIPVYCASKAAVDQITRCSALDLAPKQIRVNSVNPGVIQTDLQKTSGMSDDDYKQFLERGRQVHPLGRVGNPEEVAWAITFLASDKSSFITGVTLPVDGGRTAFSPR